MTKAKHPVQSKTVWFGIASIVIGAIAAILSLLDQQNVINIQTGVWAVISGLITVFLRYKTTIALALRIDDPTTVADESKGEVGMDNKGFAKVGSVIAVAIVALSMLFLIGCGATFTASKGQLVTMDIKASQPAHVAAYIAGVETCKIKVPEGTIRIKNVCTPPLVSTMTPDNEPTCVVNPCAIGTLIFEPSGLAICK